MSHQITELLLFPFRLPSPSVSDFGHWYTILVAAFQDFVKTAATFLEVNRRLLHLYEQRPRSRNYFYFFWWGKVDLLLSKQTANATKIGVFLSSHCRQATEEQNENESMLGGIKTIPTEGGRHECSRRMICTDIQKEHRDINSECMTRI